MGSAGLDPAAILASLGITGATAVVPVHGGWDTSIWRVEHEGSVYALRVFRAEQSRVYRSEVVAMRAAADGGIPVPRIHAEGAWEGRPVLLLSWCAGQPLVQELVAQPWRAWMLGMALGQMQARIHTVPPPDGLRPDTWIDWAGADEAPLQARLRALARPSDALLHLDYHPLNVMSDGGRVTCVLDWTNARPGDPRADLARTVTILRLSPVGPGGPPLVLVTLVRRLLEGGWRRGYRQVAGPSRDMALFYAWAGAVMVRDLAPRVGRRDTGLKPRDLDRIRRWTAIWKRRAGIPAGA